MHENAPELDVAALVEILDRNGVVGVVIGGVAAIVLGYQADTRDLDLVPADNPENLLNLTNALVEMDAEVLFAGKVRKLSDGEWLRASFTWNFRTKHGDFDVLFRPAGTNGFDGLREHARAEHTGSGATFFSASLADLIAMKEAANRPKDRSALEALYYLRDRPQEPPPVER